MFLDRWRPSLSQILRTETTSPPTAHPFCVKISKTWHLWILCYMSYIRLGFSVAGKKWSPQSPVHTLSTPRPTSVSAFGLTDMQVIFQEASTKEIGVFQTVYNHIKTNAMNVEYPLLLEWLEGHTGYENITYYYISCMGAFVFIFFIFIVSVSSIWCIDLMIYLLYSCYILWLCGNIVLHYITSFSGHFRLLSLH